MNRNRTVKAERGPLALRCGGSFGALPLLTEGLAAPAAVALYVALGCSSDSSDSSSGGSTRSALSSGTGREPQRRKRQREKAINGQQQQQQQQQQRFEAFVCAREPATSLLHSFSCPLLQTRAESFRFIFFFFFIFQLSGHWLTGTTIGSLMPLPM